MTITREVLAFAMGTFILVAVLGTILYGAWEERKAQREKR